MNIDLSQNELYFDVQNLPATQVVKGAKVLGVFFVVLSIFLGGMPTFALIQAVVSGKFKPDMFFILIFSVVGTGLFIFGLSQFFKETSTTIDAKKITVKSKSLFGRTEWSEPLSNYEGIFSRSEYHSGGKNQSSYTLYIVELLHNDKKKKIKLYQSKSNAEFRTIWEDYCRKLNLPAVEKDGEKLIKRDFRDLNKSVKEMAAEGKVKIQFDPSAPVPAGLQAKPNGDMLEITIARKGVPLIGMLIAMTIPGIFIYIGFFVKNCPIIFGIFGIVFDIILGAVFVWLLITKEQVLVGKEEIHIRRVTPWGTTAGKHINASEIETVRIGKKDEQGSEAVIISTDKIEESVGGGLPDDALNWLKNCIMAIISL